MLSKNKIKFLSSLSDKKTRLETSLFLVEGEKMVFELLDSKFEVVSLLYTEKLRTIIQTRSLKPSIELIEITDADALKISTHKTPQGIIAVARIPADFYSSAISYLGDLVLALHDIQDPGNLGTIVRTADWFGIKKIICSKSTVDILNPKVLQSTMGAIFRVKMSYTDLTEYIGTLKKVSPETPILAAVLEGTNIYKENIPSTGILMMGNESKGLSENLINLATHKITIPHFNAQAESSESLNVAIATSIILSELKRRTI